MHTYLLVSGVSIPTDKYNYSANVGLRHAVIDRHALFSSGYMSAYVDLAHTGAAYSLPLSSTWPMALFL